MRNRLETSQEQIGLPSDRTDKNYRNKFSPHKRSVAADPDSIEIGIHHTKHTLGLRRRYPIGVGRVLDVNLKAFIFNDMGK